MTDPTSDGQLLDLLHAAFGVGDFDEAGDVPWWKFRMIELAKLKAIRRRRNISLADFTLAIRYCQRHQVQVSASWQVCGYIADAKREARRIAVPELSAEVNRAIHAERTLPGPDSEAWIERLLLARGPFRRDVLDEWTKCRQSVNAGDG